MKIKFIYLVVFVLLFYLGYKAAEAPQEQETVHRTKILMGTVVDIQVMNVDKAEAEKAIDEAFSEINRIDQLFSVYDESAEVFRINNSPADVYAASGDIRNILDLSDSVRILTGGAFDVSLGNLTGAWGFDNSPSFPGYDKIKNALAVSGWSNMEYSHGILRKKSCMLNFGAVAKGYAVDRAVEVLKAKGIEKALVNAGGEIRTIGSNWSIGIQDPRQSDQLIYTLNLKGMSVATSGDYEQYFEFEGRRYHHILDPATGLPGNKCRSVTVISKEDAFADALATGIFIMGPAEGISLAEKLSDTEVMIVDDENKIWKSSGFNNYILR